MYQLWKKQQQTRRVLYLWLESSIIEFQMAGVQKLARPIFFSLTFFSIAYIYSKYYGCVYTSTLVPMYIFFCSIRVQIYNTIYFLASCCCGFFFFFFFFSFFHYLFVAVVVFAVTSLYDCCWFFFQMNACWVCSMHSIL